MMEINHQPTGIPALDALYPTTPPTHYLVKLLVFGGLTWTLCKKNIREVYQVDKKAMLVALSVGIGIILLNTVFLGL